MIDSMYQLGVETDWEADVIVLSTGDKVMVQGGLIRGTVLPDGSIMRLLPHQWVPLSDEEMDRD